jgi:S-DNA-T family DNA segregation ATPase FtsK/SpoIIIE
LLSEADNAAVARRLSRQRIDQLARGVAESPWARRLREVTAYRVRKAPRDAVRLYWFAVRGHARWIAKPNFRDLESEGGLLTWADAVDPGCAG